MAQPDAYSFVMRLSLAIYLPVRMPPARTPLLIRRHHFFYGFKPLLSGGRLGHRRCHRKRWIQRQAVATAVVNVIGSRVVRITRAPCSHAADVVFLLERRSVPLIVPHQAVTDQATTCLVLVAHELMDQWLGLLVVLIRGLCVAERRGGALLRALIAKRSARH